ncbi:hypothetical protein [uncultured Nocardioides sp.]|uniref:hypothetical protein n=1 Tax=uncultured Nocardioides sp. TaxID=198441 RepID=UPI0026266914|nr:hypothetical protein [uncultured Nocardioides sp.]
MPSPLARALAAVACSAALVLPVAAAGPAAADTEVKADPRGDVSEIEGRQAPRPSADVLQLRSRHADGVVALQVVLADLDTTSAVGTNVSVGTSDGRGFLAFVQRSEDGTKTVELIEPERDAVVPCPSLRGAVLPAADRITVSIPRQCLGRPRWVRTGALSLGVVEPFVLTYADDARRDGRVRQPFPFLGTKRLFLD